MSVKIELSGQLLPGSPRLQTLVLKRALNVREVAFLLGLNPEEVGLVVINGVQCEMEDKVPRECRLCFFPHLTGG